MKIYRGALIPELTLSWLMCPDDGRGISQNTGDNCRPDSPGGLLLPFRFAKGSGH